MTSLSGMFLLNFLKACGKTKQAKFEGADDTVQHAKSLQCSMKRQDSHNIDFLPPQQNLLWQITKDT